MKAYVQILLAAGLQRRNERGGLWSLALISAMFALPGGVVAWWAAPQVAWRWLSVSLAIFGLCLWWLEFASLSRQNNPVAARLVPGHLRRLRASAVGLWLLLTAALTVSLALTFGHAEVLAPGAGLAMLLIAGLVQWPTMLVWTLGSAWGVLQLAGVRSWPTLREFGAQMPTSLWLGVCSAGVLLGSCLLCWLIQNGSNAHARAYANRARWHAALCLDTSGLQGLDGKGWWNASFGRCIEAPYNAWLRHLTAAAKPGERHMLARLEAGMGRAGHWTTRTGSLLVSILAILAAFTVLHVVFDLKTQAVLGKFGIGLTYGILAFSLSSGMSQYDRLQRRQREQSLLMLVPAMPRGIQLNQGLARQQMRQFVAMWVLGGTLVMLGTAQTPELRQMATSFLVASMPAGLLAWRDWSRVRPPNKSSRLTDIAGIGLASGVLAATMIWLRWPLWQTFTAMLALCCIVGSWRWHRLARYPTALPVGRLANRAPAMAESPT